MLKFVSFYAEGEEKSYVTLQVTEEQFKFIKLLSRLDIIEDRYCIQNTLDIIDVNKMLKSM